MLVSGVFAVLIFMPVVVAAISGASSAFNPEALAEAMFEALKNIPLFGFVVELITYETPSVFTFKSLLDIAQETATLIVIFLVGDKAADFFSNMYETEMFNKKNFLDKVILLPVIKLSIDIAVRFVVVLILSFIAIYSEKIGGPVPSMCLIYGILIVSIMITLFGNGFKVGITVVEMLIPIISAINIMALCLAVFGAFNGMGNRKWIGAGLCAFIGVVAWIGMFILKKYVKNKKNEAKK